MTEYMTAWPYLVGDPAIEPQPRDYVILTTGERLLVGDINPSGGECGCCRVEDVVTLERNGAIIAQGDGT